MKNVRKVVVAALIGVFAFSAVGCNMIAKTEAGIKKSPVAKFDKETITKAQLDERMVGVLENFKKQYGDDFMNKSEYKEQYIQQEKSMLDSMITEKILLKKADELKLTPKDEATKTDLVNKKIEEMKKMYTEDMVKQAGFKDGYNDTKFKDYVKDLVVMDKVYEDITKDAKVEDKEVQDYYTNNQLQFTEKPNTMNVAHILSASEADAKKVKERLDKGEDFAKVAKEVSTEPAAKETGGSLGEEVPYVGSGMDQTFMNAAIALQEGKISQPVQTQYGWHIIKVIKKNEYPVKKFETVKEEISKGLLNQAQQNKYTETMSKWREEAKIKTYEENL